MNECKRRTFGESSNRFQIWNSGSNKTDAKLTIGSWNCNGWYVKRQNDNGRLLRENILTSLNCDVYGISETHLKDNEAIELDGYKWIGCNRRILSNKAWRGSGGIGFLIKNCILDNFDVDILDNSRDDILWINLKCKHDQNFMLYLCVCYLQPERSSRGNIAQEFYDHLLSQVYLYSSHNPVLICGDFNGRIGNSQDLTDSIGTLPERCYIDSVKNAFGVFLLEFLNDSNCSMLNGRGDSSKDNFTYVSPIGKSVVDYMITPHASLTKFYDFEVKLVSDLLIDHNIEVHPNSRVPDHSVLQCSFDYSEYRNYTSPQVAKTPIYENNCVKSVRRKYDVTKIPNDIFKSERCVRCLDKVVDSLLDRHNIEQRINSIYETLLNTIHDEMDNVLDYKDLGQSTHKRKRRNTKPYWNNELRNLLREVNIAEKDYLRYQGDRRTKTKRREIFKIKRRQFDKRLRQEERKYTAQRLNRIKSINQGNPKEFWREISKLGPGKTSTNIDSVNMDDGSVSHDPSEILQRWKEEYSKLFSSDNTKVDSEFVEQLQNLNSQLEREYENLPVNQTYVDNTSTSELNEPISLDETKRALMSLKNGKAVGIDNLPNEILKSDVLSKTLHELFNVCFSYGIVPDPCKAFDSVNHTILWNKLLAVGVYGNMYKVIRCLYSKLQSAVRLSPTMFTEWFSVDSGVRQGDNLAPTLFALFIDELVPLINGLCCGALIGDDMISCLLYADDLVLISGTVDGLQNQLNALNDWTKTQLMNVNTEKTKIMHIRKTTKDRTQFTFRLGDNIVAFVNKYRYLGLTLSEHIDYNVSVSEP
ncbi:unnamed protein product [Mytilus edulis]|uniref:Reverse transcriptase domain-containing protein n=1 Tax=Mytilus edulis TaxID=6550 RepID=A0A8S3QH48_MYTED|nr:unnamed protein product [Mytilus edulis]